MKWLTLLLPSFVLGILRPSPPNSPNSLNSPNFSNPSKETKDLAKVPTPMVLCNDGFFIISSKNRTKPVSASNACPSGFRLADVYDEAKFSKAASILFACQGPLSEAWVGSCKKNGKKVSGLMSLVAPNAIEKSLLGLIPAHINHKRSNKLLPALCEPIPS
ncbi:hypothetical protein PSACC_03750 [Paramicrosporidium saccamoebae]|uniref:Uncharacterized protein n=1 Tax=Paramicrosporidium saccamoebae TaxID=1246581 RepID=A0A2H9TFS3_9FUNG|nr:hypothetical protein PSACC_03750 [Paramicrosporidium saccamoebae]